MEERIKQLKAIAKEYNIEAEFNVKDMDGRGRNAGSAGDKMVWFSPFDDKDNLTAAFFHELGHCLFNNIFNKAGLSSTHYFCSLSGEATCWEIGFMLAEKHGFKWEYDHPVYKFAYASLFSYVFGEGDDYLRKDIFLNDIQEDFDLYLDRLEEQNA